MNKDAVLATLPTLTRPELEQVHAIATTLLGGRTGNVAPAASPLAGALLAAVSEAVNATVTPSNLQGTASGRHFEKHLPSAIKFLNGHFEGWQDNKLVQTAFLSMLMELLRDDLKERGVTPSIGIMISNLTRLPEVFENAYPGYLEAGMGLVVLNHFKRQQIVQTQVARKKPRRISV